MVAYHRIVIGAIFIPLFGMRMFVTCPFLVYSFSSTPLQICLLVVYFSSASSLLARSCSFSSAVISSALHSLW